MMLKEVDVQTAVMAAVSGLPVYGFNPTVPQDTYSLTEQIAALVRDGDRFLVDEPAPANIDIVIDAVVPESEVKEPEPQEEKPKKPKKKPGPKPGSKQKKVDLGKLMALYDAGWSDEQIAEEMGYSVATIRSYLPIDE